MSNTSTEFGGMTPVCYEHTSISDGDLVAAVRPAGGAHDHVARVEAPHDTFTGREVRLERSGELHGVEYVAAAIGSRVTARWRRDCSQCERRDEREREQLVARALLPTE